MHCRLSGAGGIVKIVSETVEEEGLVLGGALGEIDFVDTTVPSATATWRGLGQRTSALKIIEIAASKIARAGGTKTFNHGGHGGHGAAERQSKLWSA